MVGETRKNEVSFCADVKSWADALFASHPDWPFAEAFIEEYGPRSNKRQDLRILDRQHRRPILSGEVKMPGTVEGRSPYSQDLVRDASDKADAIQARYFFTWNVNTLVLWDRSQWDKPMIERRLNEWPLGLGLTQPSDCARADVRAEIRDKFLPRFFGDFAEIVTGKKADWGMAPDDIFLRTLESHLDWPVISTRDYLAVKCTEKPAFAARLQTWMTEEMQWSFIPEDPEDWRQALDRAARTLCYIFCNRAIFYKAVQTRYPAALRNLAMPTRAADAEEVYAHFRKRFKAAVEATGDYEPVFYPEINDWAGSLIFASNQGATAWKSFFTNLDQYNFSEIRSDILGGIFQKLISPEERQEYGQFFTHEDIVDVINAFCIRRAGDTVLDPACGSGSFLVRAYHRKAWLGRQKSGGRRHQDRDKTHQELLREIYGCDIAVFPAHLTTLNLAARQISDQESFPQVRRGNFFEVAEEPDKFCEIPGAREAGGQRSKRAVPLGILNTIVGNPPYVRQELIDRLSEIKTKGQSAKVAASRRKQTKEHIQELVGKSWSGLKLSGRSDLHCYFWPVATKYLAEGGYFGFLTSSSWLDVEYGFGLQDWVLRNFRLVAVLESIDEPWFEDARIKTAVTILQRCSDKATRDANTIKFVRLQRPLAKILGITPENKDDETARQEAAEELRRFIERTGDYQDENLRVIAVSQRRLWEEGIEAAALLAKAPTQDAPDEEGDDEGEAPLPIARDLHAQEQAEYAAGKWGRFLRAPDIYFRMMRQYGRRFVKLGAIADIKFGIKSGCDAFFMPRDVTAKVLADADAGLPWKDIPFIAHCQRPEIESGQVRVIEAGDGTIHPIESDYLKPEVHNLRRVDRPVIHAGGVDRVVLWVGKSLRDLAGTYVAKYIRWGAKQTFASRKSKAVPVPKRSTCASRPVWYDLTGVSSGLNFWPMAQQYRHVIPANPDGLVCNHNLFYLNPHELTDLEAAALSAVLNSTFLALFKTYYGRYAGTEGNLKTEVVDVNLLDVPDVRGVSPAVAAKLARAFTAMQARPTGALVEDEFMQCHGPEQVRQLARKPIGLSQELSQPDRRALDEAVLEMIGVEDAGQRRAMLDELYLETARHYRQVRIVEVQKQVQRAGSQRRISGEDVAGSVWDGLTDQQKGPPLAQWLTTFADGAAPVNIPDGKAKALGSANLYDPHAVEFRHGKDVAQVTYAGLEQAALVAELANLEIRGDVPLPAGDPACSQLRQAIGQRLTAARQVFEELVNVRTGTDRLRQSAVGLLMQWFIHGRGRPEEGAK
jgi:hypothetical protein